MNKKGFTLIELLAVIVILAIIALIATPIILNMINNARKSSAKSSALGYIDAIEYNNGFAQIQPDKYTLVTGEDINVSNINIKAKGKKPDSGKVTVNDKGKVISAELCINGYEAIYDGKDVTNVTKGCSESSNNNQEPEQAGGPTSTNVGALVYFDPVSENACDSEHFNLDAVKAGTSTCYKWRILSKLGNNLTVQLDHNLINRERWSTGTSSSSGPDKALTSLATATSSWERVPVLNNYTYDTTASNYNYGVMTCNNGICNKTVNNSTTLVAGTSDVPVRARLITGEEVTTITVNAGAANNSIAATWTLNSYYDEYYYFSNSKYTIGTITQGTNNKALSWLIENTTIINDDDHDSGSTFNTYESTNNSGYWTLSPVKSRSSNAWFVSYAGDIYNYKVDNSQSTNGVRPVITMNKSYFRS